MEAKPRGPWKSEAEYTTFLRQQTARHDQIYYAVRIASGGKACGQTSFLDIQPEHGVIEIGSIWFGLTLQLRCAMDDRISAHAVAMQCAEYGFSCSSASAWVPLRGNFLQPHDLQGPKSGYGLVLDEWPEIREIMERWLAPSNFDQDGKAKTSMAALMEERGPSRRA